METSVIVDPPLEEVTAWYESPGADQRLEPPWRYIEWPRSTHTLSFERVSDSRTRITDRTKSWIPDRILARSLAYRGRQLQGDLTAHAMAATVGVQPMTIAVTGSTGLIGTALCAFLSAGGHRIVRLVRSTPSIPTSGYWEERHWDTTNPAKHLLDGIDGIIHLAGAPVAGRFNDKHKRAVRDSRVGPTHELAKLVGTRPLVIASAVGIYGPDRGDEILTETSERGHGFLADLVGDWETAAEPARQSGSRVTHVRTGIVQSPRGGVLQLLRPLFMIGAGGRLGNGRQWTPWIEIDDMVDIYLRCLVDSSLSGPVNAVAPEPVRNAEYTKILARVVHRPAVLPAPALGPKILFGSEAVEQFVLAGQNAHPSVLESVGHQFRFRTLEPTLRHLLGRVAPVVG